MNHGCCKDLKAVISFRGILTCRHRHGKTHQASTPKPATEDGSFVADQEELNFAPLWGAQPPLGNNKEDRTYLPAGSIREKPEPPQNQVVQMHGLPLRGCGAAGPRLLWLGRLLPSSHPHGGHPAFHLGDSPRKSRTLLQDSRTLAALPNAHRLFRIHPINSALHIVLRRRSGAWPLLICMLIILPHGQK